MRTAALLAAMAAICLAGLSIAGQSDAAELAAPRMVIEGYLFGGVTGTLTENVLADENPRLDNVAIWDGYPESLLVVVRIKASPDNARAAVRFTALEAPFQGEGPYKVVASEVQRVPRAIAEGKDVRLAFTVFDPDCFNLVLTAEMIDPDQGGKLLALETKVVTMDCYE